MINLETSRRGFLKFGVGVAAGMLAGEILPYLNPPIIKAIEKSTGHPVGNAVEIREKQKIIGGCRDSQNIEGCMRERIQERKKNVSVL